MRLDIKLYAGAKASHHRLELSLPGATQTFDGPPSRMRDGRRSRALATARRPKAAEVCESLTEALGRRAERSGPQGGSLQFVLDGNTVEAQGEEISPGVYSILVGERSYEAHVSKPPGDTSLLQSPYVVTVGLRHYVVEVRDPRRSRRDSSAIEAEGPQEITAPMPGKILKLLVAENQEVSPNQGLLVIEAMKMQNELRAPRSGRVERIYAAEGMGVETGCRLLRLV
jgi:biotin carboxyl carrier protein